MFDPVALVTGGALLAVGYLAGLVRRRARPTAGPAPERCACGHVISLHQDLTGSCRGENRRNRCNRFGDPAGYEWVPCPCTCYVGPNTILPLLDASTPLSLTKTEEKQ